MTPEERIDALIDHAISVRHIQLELRSSVRCSLTEARNMGYNEAPGVATCEWHLENDGVDVWETSCGKTFVFYEDGPKENGFKFCPYCGGQLEVIS